MKIRFRIGPFTFGSTGTRLSSWKGGTGFSVPLSNSNTPSYGKLKAGPFSFFFKDKPKKPETINAVPDYQQAIKQTHKQAYEPWTTEADNKLTLLFRQGKSVKELSEFFERTRGAIIARLKKLRLID